MRTQIIRIIAILFIFNCSIKSQTLSVYFDFNSDKIKDVYVKQIIELCNKDISNIQLHGFTDTIGSKEYDNKLSQKRINAVDLLLKSHSKRFAISAVNYGEENPKYETDSLNRRVDIIYSCEIDKKHTLTNDTQVFFIDNSKDTLLLANEGTRIRIGKNSIKLADGKFPTSKLEFRLLEYYKKEDMLLANLTTTSNEKMLISGGMLYAEILNKGKKCVLAKGKSIEVSFANNTIKDSMLLFYGAMQNDKINWILPEEVLVEEPAFVIVEENAQFMGGDINAFRLFIQSRLTIPSNLKNLGTNNKAIIQFAVNSNGKVEDVKVLRGINNEFDSIAINIINKSPLWTPGKQGGRPVKQQFVIPIVFDKSLATDTYSKFNDTTFVRNYTDSMKNIAAQINLDKLVFMNVNKLGWLNCDRFYNNPYLISLNINSKEEQEAIYIVFHNMKSIIRYNKSMSVPKNKDVTLVSIMPVGNNYSYGELKTKTTNEPKSLQYEIVSLDVLKEKLKKLK